MVKEKATRSSARSHVETAETLGTGRMNLQQLRAFVVVVEKGSFTRAAKDLRLTQPAISMQVKRLQELANAPLLTKDGRALAPTDVGLTLYRYAKEVLTASDTVQRDIDAMVTKRLHHIAVGSLPGYAAYVLPHLLAQFHHTHPGVRLTLVEGLPTELLEQVRRNQVDVAILRVLQAPDDPAALLLGYDDTVVVQSARRRVSQADKLSLEEVAQAPFIRRTTSDPSGASLDETLAAAGLAFNVVITVSGWDGVKEAVRAGAGMAIALRGVVRSELESGEFLEVTVEGYQSVRPVYLLTSAFRRQSRQSPDFVELVATLRSDFPLMRRGTENAAVASRGENGSNAARSVVSSGRGR